MNGNQTVLKPKEPQQSARSKSIIRAYDQTIENVNELQNEYKSKRTTAREWVEKKEKERQDDERKRERDAFSQQYHAWDGELQSGMHSIFSRVSFQKRSIIFGYLVAKLSLAALKCIFSLSSNEPT